MRCVLHMLHNIRPLNLFYSPLHLDNTVPRRHHSKKEKKKRKKSRCHHDISLVRVIFKTGHLNSLLAFSSKGEGSSGSVKAMRACMLGFPLGKLRGFISNGCDLRHMCVGKHVFPTALSNTGFFFPFFFFTFSF